jgi:hypothetical protein
MTENIKKLSTILRYFLVIRSNMKNKKRILTQIKHRGE